MYTLRSPVADKTVVIRQPDFLPYLGIFHRFLNADLWVMLDNVQFARKSSKTFQNRDKIKTPQGERWITVAVQKCPLGTAINKVLLSKSVNWREDSLNLITQNYRSAAYFNEIFPHLEALYRFECDKMIDFNLRSITMLFSLLDIRIETIFASALQCESRKNELLVDIMKKTGGSVYLSGVGAEDYFDRRFFDEGGIKVAWQDFKHPVYPQLHGDFIPYLSSIDILFNCGIEKSRQVLRGC